MATKHVKLNQSFPQLSPTGAFDYKTGEKLPVKEWEQPILEFGNYVQTTTIELYNKHKNLLVTDPVLHSNKNTFAKQYCVDNGIRINQEELKARKVFVPSRVERIVQHKLLSGVTSWVRNPQKNKVEPSFDKSFHLSPGADLTCSPIEIDTRNGTLSFIWKVWNRQLVFNFLLPKHIATRVRQETFNKITYPIVHISNGRVTFQFVLEQKIAVRGKNKLTAGVDLGVRKPYVAVVANKNKKRVASYEVSNKLNRLYKKNEQNKRHVQELQKKIERKKAHGIGLSMSAKTLIQTREVHRVNEALTRSKDNLARETFSELAIKLAKHESLGTVHVEQLNWVSGATGAKTGTTRWNYSKAQDTLEHSLLECGILTKKINPKNSSQMCINPGCYTYVNHNTRSRLTICPSCKNMVDRDYLGAYNTSTLKHLEKLPRNITGFSGQEQGLTKSNKVKVNSTLAEKQQDTC